MAQDIYPARGMRDFLPQEKLKRNAVLNTIRDTYIKRGFQEIETPALEDIDRLTSSQGGDNEKLAFRVMKRGEQLTNSLADNTNSNGNNLADLGLRYDLTVPLARYYATNRSKLPTVFKSIQIGPVWRAERPQKGRYRQFVQCDIDIIGDSSTLAEIDLLISSLEALDSIGVNDAVIRINNRELLNKTLDEIGIPDNDKPAVMIIIDKLDKIKTDGVIKELTEKFGSNVADSTSTWLSTIDSDLAIPTQLQEIFTVIESQFGKGRLRFDPTLVRGMGYYTGTIFEIEQPGTSSSIGGGGRYDGMLARWSGKDVPAIGISIGFERVIDLVPDSITSPQPKKLVLLLKGNTPEILQLALARQKELFKYGYTVRLELMPKNRKQLLDSLENQGFTQFQVIT